MRKTTLATVFASVLLSAAAAQAGDTKVTQEQFSAADANHDGSLTLAEAQKGMPTAAAKFTAIDANGDGKLSQEELNAWSKNKSMEADQPTNPTKGY